MTNCHPLKLKTQNGKYCMTDVVEIEVILADLGEIATREIAKERRPFGLEQNRKVVKMGGNTAKVAKEDLEKKLGRGMVSKENALSYKYSEEDLLINNHIYEHIYRPEYTCSEENIAANIDPGCSVNNF